MKLALSPLSGITDRLDLINRQRRHYLKPDAQPVQPGRRHRPG